VKHPTLFYDILADVDFRIKFQPKVDKVITMLKAINCLLLKLSTWMHYFTFFAHTSQYLSIRVMSSSTLNKASWVATLPQCAQNFVLPLCLTNGPNDVNLFSTWFSSRESQQVQFLQYYSLFFTNQNCLIYKNTIRHCCRQIIYRHFAWHWPLFLVW
jgi:hypothetical protein